MESGMKNVAQLSFLGSRRKEAEAAIPIQRLTTQKEFEKHSLLLSGMKPELTIGRRSSKRWKP